MYPTRLGFYRDPIANFERFRNQMNALRQAFETLETGRERRQAGPRASVIDRGESFVVQMAVPGLSEDNLNLSLAGETLTIKGEVKNEPPEGYTAVRLERQPGAFTRSFSFPQAIDADGVQARLEQGVLTVELPRSPELKPRTIPVQVG